MTSREFWMLSPHCDLMAASYSFDLTYAPSVPDPVAFPFGRINRFGAEKAAAQFARVRTRTRASLRGTIAAES